MWISFCWEVLSGEVHRAITEVATLLQEHTWGRVEEGTGTSLQTGTKERDRPWFCGAVKTSDNFHGVEGEKEESPRHLWLKPSGSWNKLSKYFANPKKWVKANIRRNSRINGIKISWQTKQMEDRLLLYSFFEGIKSLIGLFNIFHQSWPSVSFSFSFSWKFFLLQAF